jgi:hypothetical protein
LLRDADRSARLAIALVVSIAERLRCTTAAAYLQCPRWDQNAKISQ